jgi:undecaprenyl-diphosphatase
MDEIQAIDWGTYAFFWDLRKRGAFDLQPAAQALAALGSHAGLAVMAVCALVVLAARKRYRAMNLVFALAVAGLVVVLLLKALVARVPSEEGRQQGLTSSFPSPGAFFGSYFLAVAALAGRHFASGKTRWAIDGICVLLILLIGASQMYLGLHLLTDVVAGWAGGMFLALAADWLAPLAANPGFV